ncbi:hypothetical protein Bbelb_172450 [Branchiostoma belcheri]|nr:hypothetical protein Bbelb_172450 [Branchiostoma belcheri]
MNLDDLVLAGRTWKPPATPCLDVQTCLDSRLDVVRRDSASGYIRPGEQAKLTLVEGSVYVLVTITRLRPCDSRYRLALSLKRMARINNTAAPDHRRRSCRRKRKPNWFHSDPRFGFAPVQPPPTARPAAPAAPAPPPPPAAIASTPQDDSYYST